jgi:hypothetical protein
VVVVDAEPVERALVVVVVVHLWLKVRVRVRVRLRVRLNLSSNRVDAEDVIAALAAKPTADVTAAK